MRAGGIEWVTRVTAVVAIYGAILSTYNAFSKWREERRTVRVGLRYGIDPENPELFLSAVNTGKRPVVLVDYWLELPKKKKVEYEGMQYIGDSSPVDLKEGHSYECWTPGQDLAMHLKKSEFSGTKLVAVFQDSLGVRHHSKPLRFEIETYLVKKVEDPSAGDSHT